MKSTKIFTILIIALQVLSCKKEDEITNCDIDPTNTLFCNTINKNNTVNGFIKNFYPSSSQIESEGNYTNGIPTGFWKFYFLNGNLKYEGNYTNQKQNGFCKEYYENGFLKEEGNFNNCVRDGFYKFYHGSSKDKVESEGNYLNGVKTGEWKFYNNQGKILKTVKYKC